MAITTNTSDYYTITGISLTVPFTVCCWFRASDITNNHVLAFLDDTVSGDNALLRARGDRSGDPIMTSVFNGASAFAETSTAFSAGTYRHAAGVWASATSRSAYLDGGGLVTNTTNIPLNTMNRLRIGDSSGGGLRRVAEFAIWSIALSTSEIGLLANGISPLIIKPQNLYMYIPFVGGGTQDLIGGFSLSATGAPAKSPHVNIISPYNQQMITLAGAAPPVAGNTPRNPTGVTFVGGFASV